MTAAIGMSVILSGDPVVIDAWLRARGGHSRFERAENNSEMETGLYVRAVAALQQKGWSVPRWTPPPTRPTRSQRRSCPSSRTS